MPHPGKLGRQAYQELLEDLNRRYEGIILEAGHGRQLGEAPEGQLPPLAKFITMKANMDFLERALRSILSDPRRVLVADRAIKRLNQGRKADQKTVLYITRKPEVLAAIRPGKAHGHKVDPNPYIDLPVRTHTFDTPANRYIVELLIRISKLASELKQALTELAKNRDFNYITKSRLLRWAEESDKFTKRIGLMRSASFLKDIKPSLPGVAAMLALKGHPAYSRFDKLSRRILRPTGNFGCDNNLFNMRSTWQVYEYWVFYRLAELLREAWPELSWSFSTQMQANGLLFEVPVEYEFKGNNGKLSVSLIYQKTYQAYKDKDNIYDETFISISKEFKPDFILTITIEGKEKVLIFDAKYRTSCQSIHEALREIHIYRDALRKRFSLMGTEGAFIITPSCEQEVSIFFTDKYRYKYNFGGYVFSLDDNDQSKDFSKLIINKIKSNMSA